MKKWFFSSIIFSLILCFSLFILKTAALGNLNNVFFKKKAPSLEISMQAVVTSLEKDIKNYQVAEPEMHQAPAEPEFCKYELPANPSYKAEFVDIINTESVKPGDSTEIKFYIKNTGNVRWYGEASKCQTENLMHLGTAEKEDRSSIFYEKVADFDNGWASSNRIKMIQEYIDPGETATFSFFVKAPAEEGAYIEYFSPVVEKINWLSDLKVYFKLYVGNVSEADKNILKLSKITISSSNLKPEDRWRRLV